MELDASNFLEYLKNNKININDAVKKFVEMQNFESKEFIFYELLKIMKENNVLDLPGDFIEKFFNGKADIIFDFYKNDFNEIYFPVVGESSDVKIIRAMVFETNQSYTNLKHIEDSIKKIEKLVGKKLGVIFDNKFDDRTFELAVAIGALCKKIPKGVAFTGEIDENGNVLRNFNKLGLKLKLCAENELNLVSPFDVNNVFDLKKFFEARRINFPVLISLMSKDREYLNASYEDLKDAVSKDFDLEYCELFEKIYGVRKIFIKEGLEDNWYETLKEVSNMLNKIISKRGIPHISIAGPSAFSMALGVSLGVQNPIVVYHKSGSEYKKVIDLIDNVRKIKNIVNDYKHIKYSIENEDGESCAFILYFASHNPYDTVKNFLTKNKVDARIVLIEPKAGKGNLIPDDWSGIVSEIMSVTQNLQFEYSCKKSLFFLSCPVPIAFGIGLSFGDFSKGSIYHFDKNMGDYIEVFKIEGIKSYVK